MLTAQSCNFMTAIDINFGPLLCYFEIFIFLINAQDFPNSI